MSGLTDGIDVDVLASSGSTTSPDLRSARPGDDLSFRGDFNGNVLSVGDSVMFRGTLDYAFVIGFLDRMVKVYFTHGAGAYRGAYIGTGAYRGTDLLLVGRSQSHGPEKPTEAKPLCS
jgi:hypothetical protein